MNRDAREKFSGLVIVLFVVGGSALMGSSLTDGWSAIDCLLAGAMIIPIWRLLRWWERRGQP